MMRRGIQTLKSYLRLAGYVRWSRALMAFVMVLSVYIPIFSEINDIKAYALTTDAKKVVGEANSNLSAKFSFDKEKNRWQFNKDGSAALASDIAKQQGKKDSEDVANALSQLTAKQVGGSGKSDTSLYSVNLPVKAKEGITYYDNVTRLSFKMIPDFTTREGKLVDGRIVYPFGGGKVVYTAKPGGLKEDIVLSDYISDTLRYGYKLELPETLQARINKDGSVGIYSANPALFGNISFSNEDDRARVMEGRKNGDKTNLVFSIPAPIIKDQTGVAGHTEYELRDGGKSLTVVATQLKNLHYPLSVDPSVTVTSTSDFLTGNNEGMAGFGTTGQISRDSVTGGTFGAWHFTDNSVDRGTTQNAGSGAASGMITARNAFRTAVYNNYIYAIGGSTPGVGTNLVERAPINSDGTLGTWISSGTLPEIRDSMAVIAYNGYLYIIAGYTGGGSYSSDVKFAAINTSDGSLGSWTPTTSLPIARNSPGAAVYNNTIYVINGCTRTAGQCNTGSPTAVVYCATVYATGNVGTWNSCNTTGLTARAAFTTVAYNGYLYGAGGCATYAAFACTSQPTTIQYAKINSDGSLGNWNTTSTSFTTARDFVNLVVYNGYLYLTGADTANYTAVMQYAPLYANGDVGTWKTGQSYTTNRTLADLQVYRGYLYMTGGCTSYSANCATAKNDVQFSKIDMAGSIEAYSTLADFDTTTRSRAAMVAGAGYIYILGGRTNASGVGSTSGRYAAINSDGSLGTWNATTAFADLRQYPAALIYGNSLYLIGGNTNTASGTGNCTFVDSGVSRTCTKVERATIDPTTGQLTWVDSFTYYVDNPRSDLAAVVNGGYMYVIGGIYNNFSSESAEVDFAPINSDGTLGTFTKTTAGLSTARGDGVGAVAWNGRIYVIGGREHPTGEYATPNPSTGDITSWASAGNALPLVGGQNTRSMSVSGSRGYIYVTGGVSQSLNIASATQIAKINSDGTLSNWSQSLQSMTETRYDHSSTAYNGFLYIAGGCNTTVCTGTAETKSYQYAHMNIGGRGITGTWSNKGSFTTARSQAATATYNGYIYLTGGCSSITGIAGCAASSSTNDSRYASIADDGSLTWSALNSNVPTSRYGHASVAYNGYLYVIGGCSSTGGTNGFCTSFLNDVQKIALNSDGNTTGNSWGSAGTTLNTARYGLSATAYNGYMYVTGGCSATTSGNCSTAERTVEYAQINSDGTLGNWNTTGGSGFTTGRFLHNSIAYGGKLYTLAGCSVMSSGNCSTLQNDVQFATINSNGTVSSTWNAIGYFPTARYGASLAAQNGTMYLVGGCSANSGGACTAFVSDVLSATVGASGNLEVWNKQVGTSYTDPRYLHSSLIANGYVYLFGGVKTGPTLLADSMGTSLQLLARIGRYSKMITVNPTTDIAGVYYNGSLDGGSTVQYRVAPSSGIFGSAIAAGQGSGSEPTPQCGAGSIFYVQVVVTMGDLSNAAAADDNTSNVTDITIYYRLNATPPPNLRMNGGKWFYSETQQPLDICKQFGS